MTEPQNVCLEHSIDCIAAGHECAPIRGIVRVTDCDHAAALDGWMREEDLEWPIWKCPTCGLWGGRPGWPRQRQRP